MIRWKKSSHGGQRHVLIDNSYHLYQNIAYDSDAMRSEGWTGMQGAFTHPDIQGEEFRHLFPVSTDLRGPSSDVWSPYLSFCTERCTMFLGSSYIDDWFNIEGPQRCLIMNLNDNSGLWTGVIDSWFTSEDKYIQGNQCELIAISEASCQRKDTSIPKSGGYRVMEFEEMGIVSEIKGLELYEFYNVLWIEWRKGIAYRKALAECGRAHGTGKNPR
jgi:hypothetical protein